ncbi:MAG: DegT/DnrJ/EryC1/StrS family aminotransferase [Candidatus Tectomicrobia bacterium]|nr:DegT/DnrJ/EryC1/StrS family aminotransferase [Candidatus Tectomicrobia bacterium]
MIPHSRPWFTEEDAEAVAAVVRRGQVAGGAEVAAFEAEIAAWSGQREAVAASSGTAALSLALGALGVGPGDEVVIPSYVCSALYHAVRSVRATPVLADCAPGSYAVSAATLQPHLGPATRAVILPHLFGFPAAAAEVAALGVPLIEDCAMALGATREGRPVGSFGRLAVFSFYATKLLATGEGGMVATSSDHLAARLRRARAYDERQELEVCFNYKLTDLQAALGRSQLRRYPLFLARRREIAARYAEAFADLAAQLPVASAESTSCWFRYVVRCRPPLDGLLEAARAAGVGCARPVFRPLHRYLGQPDEAFPEAAALQAMALSIPCYPALSDAEVERVIRVMRPLLQRQG